MTTAYFDIDDTVLSWNVPPEKEKYARVLKDESTGVEVLVLVNERMIAQIKKHLARGHRVVFWSAGGEEWAKRAASFVGLTGAVTCLSKPNFLYDDREPVDFLPNRQWFDF